jgi:hypothetical protein
MLIQPNFGRRPWVTAIGRFLQVMIGRNRPFAAGRGVYETKGDSLQHSRSIHSCTITV